MCTVGVGPRLVESRQEKHRLLEPLRMPMAAFCMTVPSWQRGSENHRVLGSQPS